MRQLLATSLAICACAIAGRVEAQPRPERVWIDVDVAAAAAPEDAGMRAELPRGAEATSFEARYGLPRSAALDFGGGVMLTPKMGIGVSVGGTVHERAAVITTRVPHPFFPDTFASDTADTDRAMQRIERTLNVQAMLVAARTPRFRVRVFGGPSVFRIDQDAVREMTYTQIYFVRLPTNIVQLTSYDLTRVSGVGWGAHAGGDGTVFLSRHLGLGAFARYSRGTVEMENTLATRLNQRDRVAVQAGGLEVGAGVRLVF